MGLLKEFLFTQFEVNCPSRSH